MAIPRGITTLYRLVSGRDPFRPAGKTGWLVLIALAWVPLLLGLFLHWLYAEQAATFDLYGINSAMGLMAVFVTVAALFAGRDHHVSVFGHLLLIQATVTAVTAAPVILAAIAQQARLPAWVAWGLAVSSTITLVAAFVFAMLAARRVFSSAGSAKPLLRSFGYNLALVAAFVAFPHSPTFTGPTFERSTSNIWEYVSALRTQPPSEADMAEFREIQQRRAATRLAQPRLMDASLASLSPPVKGQPNIFILGIAGWSRQDVFLKEVDAMANVLGARLGAGGRAVTLVNNPSTLDARPIASLENLALALRGIATRMDRERDVLLLAMTSHGSAGGFALSFGNLVYETLTPELLKMALDEAGIRNRILIVSACNSGNFVPVLADEDTMIMTASSATRQSFGCSDTRHLTYFGEALVENGLRRGDTLIGAFVIARDVVGDWEREQKLTPSQPQIHVGARLRSRLGATIGSDAEWMRLASGAAASLSR